MHQNLQGTAIIPDYTLNGSIINNVKDIVVFLAQFHLP